MPQSTSAVNIITVTGQYGSNSDKLATYISTRLRWRLMGDNLTRLVAAQLRLPEEELAVHDQHIYSLTDRFLFHMAAASTLDFYPDLETISRSTKFEPLYHKVQRRIIEEFALVGNVVFVGRGSQILLAHLPQVLHIRVTAPLHQRVQYLMQREHISSERAHNLLKRKERSLSYYHTTLYKSDVNDPRLYDLVLNSGAFSLDEQVDLICKVLEKRGYRPDHFSSSHASHVIS